MKTPSSRIPPDQAKHKPPAKLGSEMIWGFCYLVADLAALSRCLPGDLILIGTPANSRPVEPGDVVAVEVEAIGTLTNTVTEGRRVDPIVGAQPTRSEEVLSTALGGDWEWRGIRPPN